MPEKSAGETLDGEISIGSSFFYYFCKKNMENLFPENFEPKSFIYTPPVVELVKISNKFCTFTEQSGNEKKKDFILQSLQILSEFYSKYISLQVPDNLPEEETQKFVSEADWVYIEDIISTLLGSDNTVVELQELDNNAEPSSTELSECFADIYQILKDYTTLYQMGSEEATESGFKEFHDLLMRYVGPRNLLLLKELHGLYYGIRELIDEDEKAEKPSSEALENKSNEDRWVDNLFED